MLGLLIGGILGTKQKKKFLVKPKYSAIINLENMDHKRIISNYRYVRRYEIKNFIDEPIFFLNLKNSVKTTLNFYKKLGFYKIQINKENFLVDHRYYESLSRKVYFIKKQKFSFLPNNKFEKIFFKNPKKIYDF